MADPDQLQGGGEDSRGIERVWGRGSPIRVGAVAAVEVGEFVEAELLARGGLLVYLDAEAGGVGDVELGAVEDGAKREEVVVLAGGGVARGEGLEPGEVGDGGGEVDAGGGADGAERVVGHEVDVVGLTPAGDLHGFGEAADVADVKAGEVGEAALYIRKELPL